MRSQHHISCNTITTTKRQYLIKNEERKSNMQNMQEGKKELPQMPCYIRREYKMIEEAKQECRKEIAILENEVKRYQSQQYDLLIEADNHLSLFKYPSDDPEKITALNELYNTIVKYYCKFP